MSRRAAIEEYFRRRHSAKAPNKGYHLSQEDLEAQKAHFFATGGCVQQIPTGVSGVEFKMKRSTAPGEQHIWAKQPIKAG